MGTLTRLEQRILEAHALEGRVGEVFGWRLAAETGGWALVPRRDAWQEARSRGVRLVSWTGPEGPPVADTVVVHLQKGRAATREGVWRGWSALADGGRVVLAGGNDLGVKTAVRRLGEELGQSPETVATGGRGRAAVFIKNERCSPAPPEMAAFEAYGLRFETGPGVFSAGELDPGSALLLESLAQEAPASSVFDPGCGCGVLGLAALSLWPEARATLADVDARAVAATDANARMAGLHDRARCFWWDARIEAPPVSESCDLAVVNPPFHAGGAAVDLTPARAVFAAVGKALTPGGRALVVANRTLPWEQDLETLGVVRMLRQTNRYKVLMVTRG